MAARRQCLKQCLFGSLRPQFSPAAHAIPGKSIADSIESAARGNSRKESRMTPLPKSPAFDRLSSGLAAAAPVISYFASLHTYR